jgi:hypothetical protein
MLTFIINLYCPKTYHRPDDSIFIVKYHREKLSPNPTSSPRHEPRTVFGIVTLVHVISSPKQIILFFAPFVCRAWFPSYWNHLHWDSNPAVFLGFGLCSCDLLAKTNNFGLGAVLLSCLVSELQEPLSPRIELRTLFQSFDLSMFSSCLKEWACQVWCKSVYPVSSYKRTYIQTYITTISNLYGM